MSACKALRQARAAGADLAERLGLETELRHYECHRWRGGTGRLPTLHLEDLSEIPFVSNIPGIESYQHRARVRARAGDVFAAVRPADRDYLAYCEHHLGFGDSAFLQVPVPGNVMAVAAACGRDGALLGLGGLARRRGGLVIHPYMGIEAVWELAARVRRASGTPTYVLAPPPPVTRLANDKGAITELVRRVAGEEAVVETLAASDPIRMACGLAELAGRHRRVALKRVSCASAMGNRVYEAAFLRAQSAGRVEALVRAFLRDTAWSPGEPVLAVAWVDASCSPSTQLWLPPAGCGLPRLDGIYEQILAGPEQVFVGSRPAALPRPLRTRLADLSLRVAVALQTMGYVGRCSFDFLVAGKAEGQPRVLLTECNGRWGGTSTPMHMVDRWFPAGRPAYVAQDFVHPALRDLPFGELLRAVGPELFDPRTGRGRYAFYNAGCLEGFGKIDVIAFGRSRDEAWEALQVDLPRRVAAGRPSACAGNLAAIVQPQGRAGARVPDHLPLEGLSVRSRSPAGPPGDGRREADTPAVGRPSQRALGRRAGGAEWPP